MGTIQSSEQNTEPRKHFDTFKNARNLANPKGAVVKYFKPGADNNVNVRSIPNDSNDLKDAAK